MTFRTLDGKWQVALLASCLGALVALGGMLAYWSAIFRWLCIVAEVCVLATGIGTWITTWLRRRRPKQT